MKTLSGFVLSSLALCGVALSAEKKAQDPAKLEEMTRLQILLDRANFGPGKIDGRVGEFTDKALQRYRASHGGTADASETEAAVPAATSAKEKKSPVEQSKSKDAELDLTGLDLGSVGEAFVNYTVTKEDVESVGDAPKEPKDLAKLKSVPYRSVLEAVAEKFHADMDFLKEINPDAKLDALKEGDALKVPNVEPFELAAVKLIKPGEASQVNPVPDSPPVEREEKAADSKKSAKKTTQSENSEAKGSIKLPEGLAIFVDTKDKMLEVREGDRLVAAFPVTPGSDSIPTPTGEWEIKGVAKMPDFRHDEKMLKEGERGDDAHLIPPGPNNPVGVIWIALNKKGIGIHGTDDPETIGRAASHGCIRLANWDAAKLARMVKAGVPVTIK
jgi:lipoprotein-anchoring transpeptidase ErfK/SrfK